MTTTENNMQNLHPDIQQRLYDLTVLTYISNNNKTGIKYRCFKFPDRNLDIKDIKDLALGSNIFINKFASGDIQVSWYADEPEGYKDAIVRDVFNKIIDMIPPEMSWSKLVNPCKSKKQTIDKDYSHSSFEHDTLRIVSSAAFRRLQNKTQVVPLCDNDIVHNRLTHSIEVSTVGKKLARMVASYVWETCMPKNDVAVIAQYFGGSCLNDEQVRELFTNNVADLVAAACLIHDIGNPPFGHQGEEALNETYTELLVLPEYRDSLGKLAKLEADIFKIEGNAQTIRLLAQNQNIDLTYATLAASIKYPRMHHQENSIYKKFNIYASEQELFNRILSSCGLNLVAGEDYERHPLVYVVEAADDICYSLFDFEDFVYLGFISEETYSETLLDITFANLKTPLAMRTPGETLEEKLNNYKQSLAEMSFTNIASKLRSEALFQLILNAFHAFKEKYDYIITGTYTIDNQLLNAKGKINGLLDIYAAIMANHPVKDRFAKSNTGLKKHSVTAGYNNIAVLKNSLGGYEIMSQLLKTHIAALHNLNKLQSQMILLTAPTEFIHKSIRDSLNKRDARSWVEILSPQQQIEQIRLLNDYLTGLTDNAALRLFRHLKGHEQVGFI